MCEMLGISALKGYQVKALAGFPLPVRHASFGELKWLAAINHSHPFRHAGEWQNNAFTFSLLKEV